MRADESTIFEIIRGHKRLARLVEHDSTESKLAVMEQVRKVHRLELDADQLRAALGQLEATLTGYPTWAHVHRACGAAVPQSRQHVPQAWKRPEYGAAEFDEFRSPRDAFDRLGEAEFLERYPEWAWSVDRWKREARA